MLSFKEHITEGYYPFKSPEDAAKKGRLSPGADYVVKSNDGTYNTMSSQAWASLGMSKRPKVVGSVDGKRNFIKSK